MATTNPISQTTRPVKAADSEIQTTISQAHSHIQTGKVDEVQNDVDKGFEKYKAAGGTQGLQDFSNEVKAGILKSGALQDEQDYLKNALSKASGPQRDALLEKQNNLLNYLGSSELPGNPTVQTDQPIGTPDVEKAAAISQAHDHIKEGDSTKVRDDVDKGFERYKAAGGTQELKDFSNDVKAGIIKSGSLADAQAYVKSTLDGSNTKAKEKALDKQAELVNYLGSQELPDSPVSSQDPPIETPDAEVAKAVGEAQGHVRAGNPSAFNSDIEAGFTRYQKAGGTQSAQDYRNTVIRGVVKNGGIQDLNNFFQSGQQITANSQSSGDKARELLTILTSVGDKP